MGPWSVCIWRFLVFPTLLRHHTSSSQQPCIDVKYRPPLLVIIIGRSLYTVRKNRPEKRATSKTKAKLKAKLALFKKFHKKSPNYTTECTQQQVVLRPAFQLLGVRTYVVIDCASSQLRIYILHANRKRSQYRAHFHTSTAFNVYMQTEH